MFVSLGLILILLQGVLPVNGTAQKKNPGPEGVGLCKSLKGFARWWREYMLPGPGCTYNFNRCTNQICY